MSANNSFKPNLLRCTNNMADKACHVVGSATQVGLTQVLGARMGIDVHWRDEHGETLATVEDAGMLLSRLSSFFSGQSDSVCLRFIDPFGDACFNQHQIPVLLSELRQALLSLSDIQAVEHLQKVVVLLEGSDQVHTYVWFVGD